ncbi:MAG: hypothetical protein M3237_04885 [Actinomycetota bacterium]|nr:hypothetical protein [Actinomycetota bacterium]
MGSAVRGPWTGPPLLLIAVTVLGFAVAPLVSTPGDATAGEPQGQVELSSGDSTSLDDSGDRTTPDSAERGTPEPGTVIKPIPRQVVGVATFNQFRRLTYSQMLSDAKALTSNDAVDIIGWQEGWDGAPVFAALHARGWTTKRFPKGAKELAVSWRRDDFTFVGADQRLVARGISDETGRYPFGDRYAIRVTLRERDTGELISVLDTHLPQAIENLDRPGRWRPTYNSARARLQLTRMAKMWDRAPGRWVVGTGDYNVDVAAESRTRPYGGLSRMFAGRAVSSYAVLGKDLGPTHPVSGRQIDYVHAARRAVRQERVEFLTHRTIPGLNSDHRPLLVRFALT